MDCDRWGPSRRAVCGLSLRAGGSARRGGSCRRDIGRGGDERELGDAAGAPSGRDSHQADKDADTEAMRAVHEVGMELRVVAGLLLKKRGKNQRHETNAKESSIRKVPGEAHGCLLKVSFSP